jgi:hypothetical protein
MLRRSFLHWQRHQRKGWAMVCLILILSAACQKQSVPDSMVGIWVTDSPRYENCFLKIGPTSVIFGDPEKNGDEYSITNVKTAEKNRTVMVTIEFVSTQKTFLSVELLYSADDGGHVLLKNHPNVIWKRGETEQS